MYIYLDESGDLGFDFTKSKTTKKFVITLLMCDSQAIPRDFKIAIRRTIKKKINRDKNISRVAELKGTNTTLQVKKYFFRQLKPDGWRLYTVILNKNRVEAHLRTAKGQSKLYNFLARFLIEQLPLRQVTSNVRLVVDRSKNRNEIKDFNQYLQNQIQALLPLNTGFSVEHLNSQESAELQVVDMFCWGIARKYECNDTEWYDIYRHKIAFETEYLREL